MSEKSLSWALLGSPVLVGIGVLVVLLTPEADAPDPARRYVPPKTSLDGPVRRR